MQKATNGSSEGVMLYIRTCFAVMVASILSGGCLHGLRSVKVVDVSNFSGQVQYVYIVVGTMQGEKTREIDLQIEMNGRQKWLTDFNKYNCRLVERRGSRYVWMFHDEKGLTYREFFHVAAPLNVHISGCNMMRAQLGVPARGALAQGSYLTAGKPDNNIATESTFDWTSAEKTDISRFNHVEKPDNKGEIRLLVKLYEDSRVRVITRSANVHSLKTELRNREDIREINNEFYNPEWK